MDKQQTKEMARLDARDECIRKMRTLLADPWAMSIGKVRSDYWCIFRPMDGNTVASAHKRCDCVDALRSAGYRQRSGYWYSQLLTQLPAKDLRGRADYQGKMPFAKAKGGAT